MTGAHDRASMLCPPHRFSSSMCVASASGHGAEQSSSQSAFTVHMTATRTRCALPVVTVEPTVVFATWLRLQEQQKP